MKYTDLIIETIKLLSLFMMGYILLYKIFPKFSKRSQIISFFIGILGFILLSIVLDTLLAFIICIGIITCTLFIVKNLSYSPKKIFKNKKKNDNIIKSKKFNLFEVFKKEIDKSKLIYNNLFDENLIDEIEFDEFLNNLRNHNLKLNFTCVELHYFIKRLNNEFRIKFPYNSCDIFLNNKGNRFEIKSVTNNSNKLDNESQKKIDNIFVYEI